VPNESTVDGMIFAQWKCRVLRHSSPGLRQPKLFMTTHSGPIHSHPLARLVFWVGFRVENVLASVAVAGIACVAVTAALLPATRLQAADRYYDVDPVTAPIDGGTANWSDANWKATADGTSGEAWTASDSAFLDAIVGSPTTTTITLGGSETATAVTFNAAGYTLTGGTLALAGSGATNWFTMNATGTIESALSVMRFKGSAEATISGGGALGGNRIVLGDSGDTTVTVRQTAGSVTTSDYMMIGGNNVANARGHYIMDGGSLQVSSGAYFGWGSATSSGTFTQNGGTVTIGGQGLQLGIGGGSGAYILNTGTLDSYFGANATTGGFTFGGDGTFKVAGGFTTQSGVTTTIASGATAKIDTNGQTVTWSNELSGPEAAGLTKSGFGTLNLNGNYTGTVTVERGLLQVRSATTLGSGTVTIPDVPLGTLASHGGAIDLNGFSFSNDFFVGDRSSGPADIGALHNSAVGTTSVLSGNVHIGGENYGGGAGDTVFQGVVSGGKVTHYAVYKQGAGTWTFANEANTFEGFWYQIGGTTEVKKLANINEASSLGQPTTSTNNQVRFGFNGSGGGRILYTGSSASTSDREFVLQGTTAAESNRIDASGSVAAATLTLTGNVTAGSGYTLALGGTNAGVNVYAGTIGNGTNLALLKDGSTTWRLTGSNTYSGATTVAAGVLSLGAPGALAGGGSLVFTGGTLQFTSGNTADYGARIKNSTSAVVIDTNGQSVTLAGGIDATNAGGLTKSGAGTLVLGGTNGYTGTTTVAVGRLAVNGSIVGGVTVQSGASLGGAGAIGGTIGGAGTVNPGNSPGILTAAAVDPTAGTDFVFEFSGTAPNYGDASASVNDVLRLTGSTPFTSALSSANTKTLFLNFTKAELAIGTTLEGGFFTDLQTDFTSLLNNQPWTNAGFQVYVRGDGSGTDNVLDGVGYYNWRNPAMFGWDQSLFLSTVPRTANFGGGSVEGQAMLLTIAVPEPSAWALALAGLACGGWALRRRRRAGRTGAQID
jgi:fibronectin-binding autotransporter adhesin